jgi:hypothetical protein
MFVNNALVLGGNCRADSLLDVIGSLFQKSSWQCSGQVACPVEVVPTTVQVYVDEKASA